MSPVSRLLKQVKFPFCGYLSLGSETGLFELPVVRPGKGGVGGVTISGISESFQRGARK